MSAHTLDPIAVAAFNTDLLAAKHAALRILAGDLAFKPWPQGVNFERNMAARKAAFAALRTPFIKLPTPRSSPSPWSVSSPSGGGGRGSARPEGVTPSSPSGPTGGGGRVFEAGGGASRATDRRSVVADSGSAKSVPFNTPPPQHLPATAPVPPPAQPLTTRDLCRLILTPFKPKPSAARRLLNRAGSG